MKNKGKIYLIICEETNTCKIGFSYDPKRRIKDIQTNNPFPLKLVSIYNGTIQVEKTLHERFRKQKLVGEWFRYGKEIQDFFEEGKNNEILLPTKKESKELIQILKKCNNDAYEIIKKCNTPQDVKEKIKSGVICVIKGLMNGVVDEHYIINPFLNKN